MRTPETVKWTEDGIRVLDQTALPEMIIYKLCRNVEDAEEAIFSLRVRGAPAIGVMAGYTLALALRMEAPNDRESFLAAARRNRKRISAVRPTAVNLAWALKRCESALLSSRSIDVEALHQVLLDEAEEIAGEDRELCEGIGRAGEKLVPDGGAILTHCNAGALATAGIGTALAPVYRAWDSGKRFRVYADETRPLLQGARLTVWELQQAGIPVTLICDGAAPFLLSTGRVDIVITGADRITSFGYAANKIGTYGVALAAAAHSVPFYIAAPSSTFDRNAKGGEDVPIEERSPEEVTCVAGRRVAPEGTDAWNPAFDITPPHLISGFITEDGLIRPPFEKSIRMRADG